MKDGVSLLKAAQKLDEEALTSIFDLYQTAYHLVVDRSRDNQHTAPLEVAVDRFEVGQTTPTQSQIEERVMMEALISAMNTELTDDQRHVIILRFLEDFSLKETADIIGKEVNNIKVIQNRGIAKLRKTLGMQLDES
jgi:RNA polymerase sigma-70 factor (ECF subfamily)